MCVYIEDVTFWSLLHFQDFTAVADALQWILNNLGMNHLPYCLDDFILVANLVDRARSDRHILIRTFEHLRFPLKSSKLKGPSTCLSFNPSPLQTTPCAVFEVYVAQEGLVHSTVESSLADPDSQELP